MIKEWRGDSYSGPSTIYSRDQSSAHFASTPVASSSSSVVAPSPPYFLQDIDAIAKRLFLLLVQPLLSSQLLQVPLLGILIPLVVTI